MSALVMPTSSFWVLFRGLETANAAKQESDICNARSRPKASIFRVNHASATGGDGHTQFARALYELNIDGICANTPAAKGRVERAHLTMQVRLVKELLLEGISTVVARGETAFRDPGSRAARRAIPACG